MSKGVIDLISILDIEPLEVNLFRGNSPKTRWQRVFGGQVIGQAMVAACRTVEGRLPHSLHCYFILPGDPQIPIIYEVERLRDGKSYATRRITAIQHGNAIFSMIVSFHNDEETEFDHQDKMPDVPPPEKLTAEEVAKQPMFRDMPDFIRRYYESDRPIELRPVELGRYFGQKIDDGRIHVWIRTAAKLPDDPALHMCALAYASDFSLLDADHGALRPHAVRQAHDAGEPRPRDVVSPPVPRRRMAALRAGFAERAGRPRFDPRPDLQARRHAGGVGGAGRLGAPAQAVMRRRVHPIRRVRPVRTATRTMRYTSAYTHGIGMMKMQRDREHERPPQKFQPGAGEDHFAPRAADVAADPAHPGRDRPRPSR